MGDLDRRGFRRIPFVLIVFVLIARGTVADSSTAADLLKSAKALHNQGGNSEALSVLRRLRVGFPSSIEASDSLSLSIEIYLAQGDVFRARYLLSSLMASFPKSESISPSAYNIAEFCYRRNLPAALDYYRIAVQSADRTANGPDIQRARLRAAELSLYQAADAESARYFIGRVLPERLSEEDRPSYRTLSIRLRWESISAKALGLSDSNVSFLHADGDDVWIGTWNGGVARYSVASGASTAFTKTAVTSRSAEAADKRIWVGTSEGLAWFSKSSARWGTVEEFQSPQTRNVKALCAVRGVLYAGTLGDGLFRLHDETWERVTYGGLPGGFITCLSADYSGRRLLIGTMTMGLLILDIGSGEIMRAGTEHPELSETNITAILSDEGGRIWIGTYGEGLYEWTPGEPDIRRRTRASGEIPDDWVLAACETSKAIYFGTFGGGVSILSKQTGTWRRFGIADGLPSLDITSIASVGPYVFFGTLGAGVMRFLEADSGN
jgi:hypothetical protein